MEPTVVCVRNKNLISEGYFNFQDWVNDPENIYIGRKVRFVEGTFDSVWRNPYTVEDFGLKECLELYEKKIREENLFSSLKTLSGKNLGCWCEPGKCHGDVLVRLWRENERKVETKVENKKCPTSFKTHKEKLYYSGTLPKLLRRRRNVYSKPCS